MSPRRARLDRLTAPIRSTASEATIDLGALIRDNLTVVVGLLAVLVIVSLLVSIWLARRVTTLETRLTSITRGADGASIEAVLREHLGTVERVATVVDGLSGRTSALERDTRLAVQRVGLVRYNPFEDTGGNQSFALALLDANDDGFVISSLHARNGTRMYAKSVSAGQAEAALSGEETEALRLAQAGWRTPQPMERRPA